MTNTDDLDKERIPQLDLDSEAKNQQRIQEIGEARGFARNQLTQTRPGSQDDEEVLWRMLEAYILEVKPEIQDTALEGPYLHKAHLGNITKNTAKRVLGPDVQVVQSSVGEIRGLSQYLELGPRNIQLTVAREGNSRSSGDETTTVSIAPPRSISRTAFVQTNEAFGQLGYGLSHGELEVHPDPI